jgi:hypothetical protein
MTTLTTAAPIPRTAKRIRTAGAWCLGAGLVGVAQAAVVLSWTHQVTGDRFSYPFTAMWFDLAQATFALQHLPLAAGVAALAWTAGARASRVARIGLFAATAGLVLLAVLELVAMSAAHVAEDSARGNLVNNSYGVPVLLTGVGLLVAGIALARGRAAWTGPAWMPWLVLALGVYVFFPLSPAIAGSFAAARVGIAGWMLLFALLGLGLMRNDDTR